MNKDQLASVVAAEVGLSQSDAKKAVEAVFDGITNGMKNGDKVSQANLGIIYRNGNGVDQDLRKSIDLLQPVKDDYFDAAGEYAVAIHQMLKMLILYQQLMHLFVFPQYMKQ